MPKQTKHHRIAKQVKDIVGHEFHTEISFCILHYKDQPTPTEEYKIWDGQIGNWYKGKTLDEAFQKFKEFRGISTNE